MNNNDISNQFSKDLLDTVRKVMGESKKGEMEIDSDLEDEMKAQRQTPEKLAKARADRMKRSGMKEETDQIDEKLSDEAKNVIRNTVKATGAKVKPLVKLAQMGKKTSTKPMDEETQIDEALDAADRYGQHHRAVKDLLKSISQHVDNHKTDALKHRDYRGKKGVHWGHVSDLANVHSQLADIHDRLAQQGEYAKVNEDVEQIQELSKKTLGSYVKKASNQVLGKGIGGGMALARNNAEGEAEGHKLVNKAVKRMTGIQKAAVKLTKEEAKNLTGLPKSTAEKNKQFIEITHLLGHKKKVPVHPTNAFKALNRYRNDPSTKSARIVSEEVELTQDELDRIEAIAATLDEARGRPPKEGSAAWKARQAATKAGEEGNEPRQHIMQQLQRAKLSMQGGADVRFENGETHNIKGTHAAKLLDKYADMKPFEKEAFQKKIGKSHEHLKSEL